MAFYFDTVANYIRGVCQIIRKPFLVPCWSHRHQTLLLVRSFLHQCLCIRNLFYVQKEDECKCVWKTIRKNKQNLRIYRFIKTCLLVHINGRKTKSALFEGFTYVYVRAVKQRQIEASGHPGRYSMSTGKSIPTFRQAFVSLSSR